MFCLRKIELNFAFSISAYLIKNSSFSIGISNIIWKIIGFFLLLYTIRTESPSDWSHRDYKNCTKLTIVAETDATVITEDGRL